jgi:hypothetical protein
MQIMHFTVMHQFKVNVILNTLFQEFSDGIDPRETNYKPKNNNNQSTEPIKTTGQTNDLCSLNRMAFKIRPFSQLKVQNFCLRFLGFWPGPKNRAEKGKHLALSVLHCILLTMMLVFELYFAFNSVDDMSIMIESLISAYTRILVILKLLIYLSKQKQYRDLLETSDNILIDGE